jgi:hypothetical protein
MKTNFSLKIASHIVSVSHQWRMDGNGVANDRGDERMLSFGAPKEEEQPLIAALRVFVEGSGLRVPRVAQLMGVGDATLSKWLAGTARPTQKKLLEIKSFLGWHGREYLANTEGRKVPSL